MSNIRPPDAVVQLSRSAEAASRQIDVCVALVELLARQVEDSGASSELTRVAERLRAILGVLNVEVRESVVANIRDSGSLGRKILRGAVSAVSAIGLNITSTVLYEKYMAANDEAQTCLQRVDHYTAVLIADGITDLSKYPAVMSAGGSSTPTGDLTMQVTRGTGRQPVEHDATAEGLTTTAGQMAATVASAGVARGTGQAYNPTVVTTRNVTLGTATESDEARGLESESIVKTPDPINAAIAWREEDDIVTGTAEVRLNDFEASAVGQVGASGTATTTFDQTVIAQPAELKLEALPGEVSVQEAATPTIPTRSPRIAPQRRRGPGTNAPT